MKREEVDVLIIGAGLTGLYLAYLLREEDIKVKILESRQRTGGRIYSVYNDDHPPLEMGATWLGMKHRNLKQLLDELEVPVFEQRIGDAAIYEAISTSPPYLAQLPPNPEPSLRIAGGSSALVRRLMDEVGSANIDLNKKVESIEQEGSELAVQCKNGHEFLATKVISTLPPHLLAKTIKTEPELPLDFRNIALSTHTWMGESIKIALTFQEPFWRKDGLSGTIISNVGPVSEMYDHSNVEDDHYALKGFLSGTYWELDKEGRLEVVLTQLRKYYGSAIDEYVTYEEAVWRTEEATFSEYEGNVLPHQNNGHPVFRRTYMAGSLFVGGTETATSYPGYMEGAVISAKEIAEKLLG